MRPVSSVTSMRVAILPKNCTGRKSLTEGLPFGRGAHGALAAHAGIGAQRHVDALGAQIPWPLHAAPGSASRIRPRAAARAGCAAPRRVFATSRHPLVSRSRRCTSSRNSSGRQARSASITPKLTPLPPCTAIPAGLSITMSRSSSWMMAWAMRAVRSVEGARGGLRQHPYRGDAHLVAEREPGLGACPLAVHPHLALADDAVHAAARHPAQALVDVVVQPLAGLILGDLEVLHFGANLERIVLRQRSSA